jgi:hypothetical protein
VGTIKNSVTTKTLEVIDHLFHAKQCQIVPLTVPFQVRGTLTTL